MCVLYYKQNSWNSQKLLYCLQSIKRGRSKSRMRDTYDSRKEGINASPAKKQQTKSGPVIIYDISCLLPIHKTLAENYV